MSKSSQRRISTYRLGIDDELSDKKERFPKSFDLYKVYMKGRVDAKRALYKQQANKPVNPSIAEPLNDTLNT